MLSKHNLQKHNFQKFSVGHVLWTGILMLGIGYLNRIVPLHYTTTQIRSQWVTEVQISDLHNQIVSFT